MAFSRFQVGDLDFDQVLSILQGWLGEDVLLTIESPAASSPVAVMRGPLAAAPDILDTAYSGRFGFTVGDGAFSIHPRQFAEACYYSDADHLEMTVADRSWAQGPALTVNVLRAVR